MNNNKEIMIFANEIVNVLKKDFLEEEYYIEVKKISKNNAVSRCGIIIHDSSKIAPTLYVEGVYKEYCNGTDIKDCASEVYDMYVKHKCNVNMFENFHDILNFSLMEGKIFPKLINYELNSEMLKMIPHAKFGNLAVIYQISVELNKDEQGTITISDEVLNAWDISHESLHEVAVNNQRNTSPTKIDSIMSLLSGRFLPDTCKADEIDLSFENDVSESMYVMSSEGRNFGAASLLDKNTLEDFASKHGSFYIIPSSVYELILLPDNNYEMSFENLKSMIKDVNDSVVAREEVLAFEPYYYDSKKRGLYYSEDRKEMRLNFVA